MEQTLLIVIDVLVLVLVVLITLLLVSWRKKTRCHAALEHLLDNVREQQGARSKKIVSCLTKQYKLGKPDARELSAVLFSAEKLFLIQFIEQQLRLQSVEGIYDNLCALLDSYLKAIPAAGAAGNARTPDDTHADGVPKAAPNTTDKSPPDWGDVFD
jgi:hypothetical protein